jgi:formylglycine-generating enzyme required for sulfatase activity
MASDTSTDALIGQILVEQKLLTAEQLEECSRAYAEAGKLGMRVPFLRFLKDRGNLTDAQLVDVRKELASRGVHPKLGDYELLEKLGQGGMGTVYKAQHPRLGTAVALKVLLPEIARDTNLVQRFVREAKLAAKLSGTDVVHVLDVQEAEGQHFIVMEYVDGESVEARIKREGKLKEGDALCIVRDVARVLGLAHQNGIIHRDVKPSNIMLTRDGRVKVSDFGLAKDTAARDASLTHSGAGMGSPHYVSPEQANDTKSAGAQADIYSLGATLYHMVTGRTPFDGPSTHAVIIKHATERVTDPREWTSDLSKATAGLILRMMEKDPAKRPQTCGEVEARAGEILKALERGAAELAPTQASQAGRQSRRWKRTVVPAICAVVALGILIAVFALLRGGGPQSSPTGTTSQKPPDNVPEPKQALPETVTATQAPEAGAPVATPPPAQIVQPEAPPAAVATSPAPAPASPAEPPPAPTTPKPAEQSSPAAAVAAGETPDSVAPADPAEPVRKALRRTGAFSFAGKTVKEAVAEIAALAEVEAAYADGLDAVVEQKVSTSYRGEAGVALSRVLNPRRLDYDLRENGILIVARTPEEIAAIIKAREQPAARPARETPPPEVPYVPQPKVKWTPVRVSVIVATPDGDKQKAITYYTNSIGMRLALIPAGEFMMGDPGFPEREPVRRVKISRAFYMGAYEVTNAEFRRFRPGHDSGADANGDRQPAVLVTSADAAAFCVWLSEQEGLLYRLPTEAEWEYACRAGTRTAFYWGNAMRDECCVHASNQPGKKNKSSDVGGRPANMLGLFDMLGNVDEWCKELYSDDAYKSAGEVDPQGPATGKGPVIRGGNYETPVPRNLMSSARGWSHADNLWQIIGLRVVCTGDPYPPPTAKQLESERLFQQAADTFKKRQWTELKGLLEKLGADYADTDAVKDVGRKPSFAEMSNAAKDAGKLVIVRQDGRGDFRTIQEALAVVQVGGVVEIRDGGQYRERLNIDREGVTIRGAAGFWPLISSAGSNPAWPVLVTLAARNVTLEHLILDHGGGGGSGCAVISGSDDANATLRSIVSTCEELRPSPGCIAAVERSVVLGGSNQHLTCRIQDSIFWAAGTVSLEQAQCGNTLFRSYAETGKGCELRNCTIGGSMHFWGTGNSLSNSIVGQYVQGDEDGNRVENCNVRGNPPFVNKAQPGKGCFSADPQLVDPAKLDYRLKPTSPCRRRASDGGDVGCRFTPEMMEMINLALQLRDRGLVKF